MLLAHFALSLWDNDGINAAGHHIIFSAPSDWLGRHHP